MFGHYFFDDQIIEMTYNITSDFFFFNHPAPTEIYPLSLHDALPISLRLALSPPGPPGPRPAKKPPRPRMSAWVVDVVDVAFADVDAGCAPTTRVTRMSVPMLCRGARTWFCALSSPCETPMIPITRPTPRASPSAVSTVRPRRRRSSLAT